MTLASMLEQIVVAIGAVILVASLMNRILGK